MTSETGLLADRTVLVTGASSGLGRHFAAVLAAAGATVVAVARRADLLDTLAQERPGILPVVADVTTAEGRERAVAVATSAGPRFTVLVNNAGGSSAAPASDVDVAEFESTLALNLVATFALSQLSARVMIGAGGGSIVNIASIFGLVASAPVTQAAYCAAKSGVVGLTRQLGCEWARSGVRVNAIAPGWFDSDLTDQFTASESGARFIKRETPIGRTGRLDELDGPLLLLASDQSSFITGHTIPVDGGWTAR